MGAAGGGRDAAAPLHGNCAAAPREQNSIGAEGFTAPISVHYSTQKGCVRCASTWKWHCFPSPVSMSSFSKATPSFQEGAGQGVGLLQHSTKGPSGWAFAAGHFEAFFFCIFRLIFYQLSVRRGQGHAAQHLPWQRAGGKQQRSAPKSTFHSKKTRHQEGKKDPTEHLFWGEKKGRNPFPLSGHNGFHFQPDKAEPISKHRLILSVLASWFARTRGHAWVCKALLCFSRPPCRPGHRRRAGPNACTALSPNRITSSQ